MLGDVVPHVALLVMPVAVFVMTPCPLEPAGDVDGYCAKKSPIQHIWPLRLFVKPWRMGSEFMWGTKKV
jgi:hypothetical protein